MQCVLLIVAKWSATATANGASPVDQQPFPNVQSIKAFWNFDQFSLKLNTRFMHQIGLLLLIWLIELGTSGRERERESRV